jgi:hypothetical protein
VRKRQPEAHQELDSPRQARRPGRDAEPVQLRLRRLGPAKPKCKKPRPHLCQKLDARRVLVLVPSLSLLGQTPREWTTAVEFDYLAVCSDVTVTKDEQDAVVASTSELGIPVTR